MRMLKSIQRRVHNRNKEQIKQRENPSVSEYRDSKSLFAVLSRSDGDASPTKLAGPKKTRGDKGSYGETSQWADITTSSFVDDASTLSGAVSNGEVEELLGDDGEDSPMVEWKVPLLDSETSEPETMEQEFRRLQCLQSYFALDTDGSAELDRITSLASVLLEAPIALISLVDLGRQYFLSRVGLDAVRETPRKYSICSHAILQKQRIMVIPNCALDERFKNNPFVTDGLKVRFYAGAALVSPEGYKLGTLCVVSATARPLGLSETQRVVLMELAQIVVSTLVSRRHFLLKQEYENSLRRTLAPTFVDLQRQLEAAQESLARVLVQQPRAAAGGWYSTTDITLTAEDAAQLTDTSRNLAVQAQVCAAAARTIIHETLRHEQPEDPEASQEVAQNPPAEQDSNLEAQGNQTKRANLKSDEDYPSAEKSAISEDNNYGLLEAMLEYDKIVNPQTDMEQLWDHLDSLVLNFPARNHVEIVTLEMFKMVPKSIGAEGMLIFRSIWNLWTHCLEASAKAAAGVTPATGSAAAGATGAPRRFTSSYCGLRIRNTRQDEECDDLLIQCMQGGPPVSYETAKELFSADHFSSLLAPVATMVRSMGGQYGMYAAPSWLQEPKLQAQVAKFPAAANRQSGAVGGADPQLHDPSDASLMNRVHSTYHWRGSANDDRSDMEQQQTPTMEDVPMHSIYWLQIPYELQETISSTPTRRSRRVNDYATTSSRSINVFRSEDSAATRTTAATTTYQGLLQDSPPSVQRFEKSLVKVYRPQPSPPRTKPAYPPVIAPGYPATDPIYTSTYWGCLRMDTPELGSDSSSKVPPTNVPAKEKDGRAIPRTADTTTKALSTVYVPTTTRVQEPSMEQPLYPASTKTTTTTQATKLAPSTNGTTTTKMNGGSSIVSFPAPTGSISRASKAPRSYSETSSTTKTEAAPEAVEKAQMSITSNDTSSASNNVKSTRRYRRPRFFGGKRHESQ